MPEDEITVEYIEIVRKMQIGLAKQERIVALVGTNDKVLDHAEKDKIPFMEGHGIVYGGEMPVGFVKLCRRLIADIVCLEITQLVGADLMQPGLPLAQITLVVLDNGFVVPIVAPVLLVKSFLEFYPRQTADPVVVPAAVDIAV